MKRIHVFAADWLPSADDVATDAGLRAAQLVEALRAGGHAVSVSVPADSRRVRAVQAARPERLREVMLHDRSGYMGLLRQVQPDVVVWAQPLLRHTPFAAGMVHVCDVHDAAAGVSERTILARHVAGADLLLTGSAGQRGFWLAELAAGAVAAAAVVPYATPAGLRRPSGAGPSALRTIHAAAALALQPDVLARVAGWCGTHGVELQVSGTPGEDGAARLDAMLALRRLEPLPNVHVLGEVPLQTLLDSYGPGSLLLDWHADGIGGLGLQMRAVDALTLGVPLLARSGGELAAPLARANAALLAPDQAGLAGALDGLAALPPETFGAMSSAARDFAGQWFDAADSQATLLDALDRAGGARGRRKAAWLATRPAPDDRAHVLVLTEQHSNMRSIRVDMPLGALHGDGRIASYSIWRKGRLGFSTRPAEPDPAFDAIWVQRELPPDMALTLGALNRPYLLDMDDNLLVSPAYRAPFSQAQLQASRSLVRGCTALTTSSDRLAGLLQDYAHTALLDRVVTCRNLTGELPPLVMPGEPGCVVWASSDVPALTGSYLDVVRAIRGFCLAYGLKLVCIGAPPPDLMLDGGVQVEHLGILPYATYLQRLRGLAPGILVAPLDTGADPATQDFIDGKSDIKILEALVTGLAGVFSDAPAYRDTDLPTPILCRNDHAGWLAGLEQARRLCLRGAPRPELPLQRMASGIGLRGWADALDRVRMPYPMRLSELEQALALTRSSLTGGMLPREAFDEAWYVSVNPDVAGAVSAGQITAYGHYVSHGYAERRPGHPDDAASRNPDSFWANVLNSLSDIRQRAEDRADAIAALRERRQRRQRIRGA